MSWRGILDRGILRLTRTEGKFHTTEGFLNGEEHKTYSNRQASLFLVGDINVSHRQLNDAANELYNKTKEKSQFEPPHDKTNKMNVRPAKTQISLGIRLVWSESSLCAEWVAKDPSFLHADSEDSD